MRRREFIAISLGAAARASVAEAQTTNRIKRVGVVMVGGPHRAGVLGLRDGLKAAGFDEAAIVLAVRDVRGDLSAISGLAKELEREDTDVLVVFGTSTALATQRSTERVPIVFAVGGDPVAFGLVESIAKPGGRLTGLHTIISDLTAKRLELLRQIVPTLRRIVTFYNRKIRARWLPPWPRRTRQRRTLGSRCLRRKRLRPRPSARWSRACGRAMRRRSSSFPMPRF